MRLYITSAGRYAGTQADAGKGFTQVEVPTDKAGLLDYLNALVDDHARTDAYLDKVAPVAPQPATTRGAQALQEGRELDRLEEWIDQAHGWQLVRLVSMVTHRLSELAKVLA